MTLKHALATAIDRFTADRVPSPRLNAETLLMFTLGCTRAYLYAHPERELTAEEFSRYDDVLSQRAQGIPSQYITGHQEFWGLDLIVTPSVLIPRPETEHLIESVLERVKASGIANPSAHPWAIADVGTGSGCIALALAKELSAARIDATDISAAALEVARINAARHQFESNIQFHHTDLLQGLPDRAFDFVVSNPPYVGDSEEDEVQLEVRKHEPRNAVFAGPTGLEVIDRLLPEAHRALKSGGWLVIEISGTIASGLRSRLESWGNSAITPDLQGISRVAMAQRR